MMDYHFLYVGLMPHYQISVRDYAFKVLEIPMLISIINHQNAASKRVAQKVGMRLMKKTNFKNVLVDVFCLIVLRSVFEEMKLHRLEAY